MTDAGAGGDAGHRGIADTGRNQPGTAPGNQQIHIALGRHQSGGRAPGGILHQIDCILRNPRLGKPPFQGIHNGSGRVNGLFASPEDAHIAAFQGQSGSIAGNIGAALIDDGYHPHGDRDLLNGQSVRANRLLQHHAHRVGQAHHIPDSPGHGGDTLRGEPEPVQHHLADISPGGGQIQGIGGQNIFPALFQGLCHGQQGLVFLPGAQLAHFVLGPPGGGKQFHHKPSSCFRATKRVPMGAPSRMA